MNRRCFILAVCSAASVAVWVPRSVCAQENGASREWIDVKSYICASVEKRDALMAIFDVALIPALNRQGAQRVGVLWTDGEINDGNTNYNTTVFVIAAFPTFAAFASSEEKLLADPMFMKDAAPIFSAPMKEPLYDMCAGALLHAFQACPRVTQVTTSPDRLLQLRIYNSYTVERNAQKIAMFEQGGEIGIFRACGMQPVFFGHALAGNNLANLTYMLGFANKDEKDAAWKKFRAHPDWLKLKADPKYKDTANKITNIVLRPSKGSQL